MKAVAFANDTVAMIVWRPEAHIPGCLGFALTRIDLETGERKILESKIPFEGQENPDWKASPTTSWPIQKCTWTDYKGRPGQTVKYEITPMVGEPDNLTPLPEMTATTNAVTFDTKVTEQISAAFTRGVLSTQAMARKLPKDAEGLPDFQVILNAIQTPGDSLRNRLMGNVLAMIKSQIEKAKAEGGHVHLALYELADPEIVAFLLDNPQVFSLILANTGKLDETNQPAREKLHAAGVDIIDRMLNESKNTNQYAIGHNKSMVRVDAEGTPVSITTGSTNWTMTGLCCQSNNIIQIESEELAKLYLDYWQLLKNDNAEQGQVLREANAKRKDDVVLADGTRITAWFSPNTKEKTKPAKDAPTPPDMAEVFQAMENAKQGVFFLAFYPGFPSIISKLQELNESRPDLILRGAISSVQALPRTRLKRRRGELPPIVVANGIEKDFAHWQKELLKLPEAHAIIHDKLLVIDPWSETDCTVVVTSHNMGFKASYSNDENMLIIKGNRKLAMTYLVHILDVYNHYRFRSAVRLERSAFKGTLKRDDTWLDKFMSGTALKELQLFTAVEPEALVTSHKPDATPTSAASVPQLPDIQPDKSNEQDTTNNPPVNEIDTVSQPPAA